MIRPIGRFIRIQNHSHINIIILPTLLMIITKPKIFIKIVILIHICISTYILEPDQNYPYDYTQSPYIPNSWVDLSSNFQTLGEPVENNHILDYHDYIGQPIFYLDEGTTLFMTQIANSHWPHNCWRKKLSIPRFREDYDLRKTTDYLLDENVGLSNPGVSNVVAPYQICILHTIRVHVSTFFPTSQPSPPHIKDNVWFKCKGVLSQSAHSYA